DADRRFGGAGQRGDRTRAHVLAGALACRHRTRRPDDSVPQQDVSGILRAPSSVPTIFLTREPLQAEGLKKYAAAGGWGSLTLRTANLPARRCTNPAFPATPCERSRLCLYSLRTIGRTQLSTTTVPFYSGSRR